MLAHLLVKSSEAWSEIALRLKLNCGICPLLKGKVLEIDLIFSFFFFFFWVILVAFVCTWLLCLQAAASRWHHLVVVVTFVGKIKSMVLKF